MTNKNNIALLISGIVVGVISFYLPQIVYYVLEHCLRASIETRFEKEFMTVLVHMQIVGYGLSVFVLLSAFLYRVPSLRMFYHRFIPNMIMFIATTVVVIAAIEFYLFQRSQDGLFLPLYHTSWHENYRLNTFGFRDTERTYENPDDAYRILVLGDSFTFGIGIKQNEDIYTYRLEDAINNANMLNGRPVEVINTGWPGSSTEEEFLYLQEKGIMFSPDFIILGFVLNDLETEELRRELDGSNDEWQLLPYPYGFLLSSYSFSYYIVNNAVKAMIVKHRSDEPLMKTHFARLYTADNSERHREIFGDLAAYCKEHGIPMLIVLFPQMEAVGDENYPYYEEHNYVESIAREHDVAFIDLLDELRNSGIKKFTVSRFDAHPSVEAHRVAADVIYEWIAEQELLAG